MKAAQVAEIVGGTLSGDAELHAETEFKFDSRQIKAGDVFRQRGAGIVNRSRPVFGGVCRHYHAQRLRQLRSGGDLVRVHLALRVNPAVAYQDLAAGALVLVSSVVVTTAAQGPAPAPAARTRAYPRKRPSYRVPPRSALRVLRCPPRGRELAWGGPALRSCVSAIAGPGRRTCRTDRSSCPRGSAPRAGCPGRRWRGWTTCA